MEQELIPPGLRAGVSWCICSGQAVFLDLPRDRYFCLPRALDRIFQAWTGGEPLTTADLAALVASGVVETAGSGAATAAAHAPAVRDLALERPHGHTVADLASALVFQLGASRALRRSPLPTIVSRLEARVIAPGPSSSDEAQLRRVSGAFVASAMLLRAHDRCLARAIAARRLCDRLGQAASLVFGVRINPFAAHSWVQCNDAVVVGDLETVRLYTPILVIA